MHRPPTPEDRGLIQKKESTAQFHGLNLEEYEFHGFWKSPLLTAYFWTVVFNQELADKLDLGISELGLLNVSGGNFLAKYSVEDQLHRRLTQAIVTQEEEFFANLKKTIEEEFQKSSAVLDTLPLQPINAASFSRAIEALQPLAFLICISYLLSFSVEKELANWAFEKGIGESEISQYMLRIDTPLIQRQHELVHLKHLASQHSLFTLPQEEALQIIESHPDLREEFDAHIAKFGWVEIIGFLGEKINRERLLEILTHFEESNSLPSTKHDDAYLLTAAAHIGFAREIGTEYFSMQSMRLRPFLEQVANHLSTTYQNVIDFTPEEIEEALAISSPLPPSSHENQWVLFQDREGKAVHITDSEDIAGIEKIVLPKFQASDTIQGQVGYRGIAQGPVKNNS